MRAAIIRKFGPAEFIKVVDDHPTPEIKDNQVLVRVYASGLNPLDIMTRKGQLKLVRDRKLPVVLGNDASGVIVRCGKSVADFQVGDEVYGMFDPAARLSCTKFTQSGACAEYAATRADTLALKPPHLTHVEAASIPLACLTAYQALRKASWHRGGEVLINGASGGVGVYALQMAKAWGARVTGVCSAKNIDLVLRLGADDVADYRSHDFGDFNDKFEAIYDVAVSMSFHRFAKLLKNNGTFISNRISVSNFLYTQFAPLISLAGYQKRNTFAFVLPSGSDLRAISEMFSSGNMHPVVGKTFPINDIVDAHRELESGLSFGKIVVTI